MISASDNKSLSANLTFVREHEPNNITVENINDFHDNRTISRSENIKPSLKLNGDFKLSKTGESQYHGRILTVRIDIQGNMNILIIGLSLM